jgi:hypothetical protein
MFLAVSLSPTGIATTLRWCNYGEETQPLGACTINLFTAIMEQHTLKNVNNCLNTNIYSYLETSGGQSSNLYLNVVHIFNNTSVN